MNDESRNSSDDFSFIHLSAEELNSYFDRFDFKCEVCKQKNWWSFALEESESVVAYSLSAAAPRDSNWDITNYTRICVTCGNTKLFNRAIVQVNIQKLKSDAQLKGGENE